MNGTVGLNPFANVQTPLLDAKKEEFDKGELVPQFACLHARCSSNTLNNR